VGSGQGLPLPNFVTDPANFAFGRAGQFAEDVFADETQGKENVHRDLAHCVGFVKPLQQRAKLVDKLREICAVVPVNRSVGNGCSGNA
jgi:hypothetical protein